MVSFGRPCNDLVAGAPGRNGTGEAYLLRGSTGARPREAVILRAPDAAPGDAFGAAVALSPRDESADHDIWVGAPGRDVAGQADAGAIYHCGAERRRRAVVRGRRHPRHWPSTRPKRATGWRGARARHGRRHRGPAARGRRRPRATRVRVMLLPAVGTARFAAGSEAGARLGAAVDYRGRGIAAGAPGADVRGRKDAGLVADFSLRLQSRRTFRQGVRGIPGRAEAGDRFGSALASGSSLRCQEDSALAVGVPGEDFRGAARRGRGHADRGRRHHGLPLARARPGPRAPQPRRTAASAPARRSGSRPTAPGLDEDDLRHAAGRRTERRDPHASTAGYSAIRHGRLSAPPGAPGYGSVFAQPF